MFIEIGVGALALAAWYAARSREVASVVPPHIAAQREIIFDTAINGLHDSKKLRELSNAFRAQGLDAQADLLEQRAQLNEATPDVKAARRDVFRKAMDSKDQAAVLATADAFDKQGATGAAASLRAYAAGLDSETVELG